MAYTVQNFKTKKAFKGAFDSGQRLGVFQPGPFGPHIPDGSCVIEGPHFPEPHKWYASVVIKDGVIVKVMS